jgi:hypothetical protein
MSRFVVAPVVLAGAVTAGGCSSGGSVPDEAIERVTAGVDQVEVADGMRFEIHIVVVDDDPRNPLAETCVATELEPAGTSPDGDRLHMWRGTPNDAVGCTLGTSFAVDGTRVYAHTPGTPGDESDEFLRWRVGETTPELVAEMAEDQTELRFDPAGLADAANSAEVEDARIAFDLDPAALPDVGGAELPDDEAVDNLTMVAEFALDDPDRLESIEFAVAAEDVSTTITYVFEDLDQPQNVEIPPERYLEPGVTQLTTLDELTAFVGFGD